MLCVSFLSFTAMQSPFFQHALWLLSVAVLLSNVRAFTVSTDFRRRFVRTTSSSSLYATTPLVVALTREEGKNEKLRKELKMKTLGDDNAILKELPCIAHADGDDFDRLGPSLQGADWDYVAVTSPEAARVLAQAWNQDDVTKTSVVAVGKATQATLEKLGIAVDFCPSKATAATLVAELPAKGDKTTLLYPASAKAASTLEEGLTARGFDVTRLNTYDTVTATWNDEQRKTAENVRVACFGSPSAVEGWLLNTNDNKDILAACIGETSAKACREKQWPESRIFFPEKPGIPGWASSVKEALETIQVAHT